MNMKQSVAIVVIGVVASLSSIASSAPQEEFLLKMIDSVSKQPVSATRIMLAPKKNGKLECTIDASLTAVSNDLGEVRIPNVKQGTYVVFYTMKTALDMTKLNGKVVSYNRVGNDDYVKSISNTLGPIMVLAGSNIGIVDGLIGIKDGYMCASMHDIGMISTDGKLLTVRAPSSAPVKITINTDLEGKRRSDKKKSN